MRDQMRSHRRHVPFSTSSSRRDEEESEVTNPLLSEDVQNVEESLKAMQNVLMAYQTRNSKRSSRISRSKSGDSFGSSNRSIQSSVMSDSSSRSFASSKSTLWS
jgi:hypothetical protein